VYAFQLDSVQSDGIVDALAVAAWLLHASCTSM
jgi:hypothetical protein